MFERFRNPQLSNVRIGGCVSDNFCNFTKSTIRHSRPLHVVICQLWGERGARVWTSLYCCIFIFTQLFLSLCVSPIKFNTMKAFQDRVSENVHVISLSKRYHIFFLSMAGFSAPLQPWQLTAINTCAFCWGWTTRRMNQFFSSLTQPLGWSLNLFYS